MKRLIWLTLLIAAGVVKAELDDDWMEAVVSLEDAKHLMDDEDKDEVLDPIFRNTDWMEAVVSLKDTKQLVEEEGAQVDVVLDPVLRYTPLHLAAKIGNPEVVQYLVDKDADVNATEWNGFTPLILISGFSEASPKNKLKVAEILLKANADPNIVPTGEGKLALDYDNTAEFKNLLKQYMGGIELETPIGPKWELER